MKDYKMTLDPTIAAERSAVLTAIGTLGGGTLATTDALAKATRLDRTTVQRYAHQLVGAGLVRPRPVRVGFSVIAYSLTAEGLAKEAMRSGATR